MKKNFIPKILFLILAVILVILVFWVLSQKKRDKTIYIYNEICNRENYTFSIIEESKERDYSLVISKKDSYMSIDAKTDSDHTTTLVKDDMAYYIMHNDQEYYVYDSTEIEADLLRGFLEGIEEKQYNYGHEKINGKEYYYEEYENITGFIMWLNYNEDENTVKTRFYFDGNDIAYIKNIVDGEEELLSIDFLNETKEELFELPASYAEL